MDKNTILTRKDGIMTGDMNGDTVMMDIETGKYYNLGEVGGRIWELLEFPTSLGELLNALTAEYNVSAEQCESDTVPFLESLAGCGLIVTK